MRLPVVIALLSALLAGVAAYLLLPGTSRDSVQFEKLTILPAGRPLPALSLVDDTGSEFSTRDFDGRWSVLFFGFTHCPDVCPTTLYDLARMQRELDDLPPPQRPAIFMVSVDPERDTPEVMARYVSAFDQGFRGLTGVPEEIRRMAESLGVAYGTTPTEDGGYEVLHTAAVFVLDDEGRLSAVASAPHDPAVLAEDFRRLLAQRGA